MIQVVYKQFGLTGSHMAILNVPADDGLLLRGVISGDDGPVFLTSCDLGYLRNQNVYALDDPCAALEEWVARHCEKDGHKVVRRFSMKAVQDFNARKRGELT